jgi:hypothetical protein
MQQADAVLHEEIAARSSQDHDPQLREKGRARRGKHRVRDDRGRVAEDCQSEESDELDLCCRPTLSADGFCAVELDLKQYPPVDIYGVAVTCCSLIGIRN